MEGIILVPEEKRREKVTLTEKIEKEIEEAVSHIKQIIKFPKPPQPQKITFCKGCGYAELCWG